MAHHKRKGPKSTRAGCLFCKYHKSQHFKDSAHSRTPQEVRADDRQESFEQDLLDPDEDDDEPV